MKALVGGLLLLCATTELRAQITITATDVAARLTVGNSLINRADTLTTSANIGAPGTTANNWNFGALSTHRMDTLRSVNPATTPYVSWFPGVTHALQTRRTFEGITGIVFQYLKLQTNLLDPGNAGDGQTVFGTAILKTTKTPNDIFYQLPLALGTTWTSTYVESLVVSIGGFVVFSQITNHSITHTVDAHGNLTLPATFGTHQALRIRNDDRASTGRTISYQIIARNGASVQVSAADTLQPNSGTINIGRTATSWSAPVQTDVRLSDKVPSAFALQQNYPNPFNPSTTIQYQVASAGFVSLRVYNLLGQEIVTLVNDVKQPGTYALQWNVEGMPSGIYFYKMQSGTLSATRRMMVVK
jgi:hypothetical protein